MSSSSNRFFEGFLVGGIFGFIGAILFAPKSGAELRKELAENSDELYRQATSSITDIKDRTQQAIQDIQHKSDAVIKQASTQIQGTREQITHKIQEFTGTRASDGSSES